MTACLFTSVKRPGGMPLFLKALTRLTITLPLMKSTSKFFTGTPWWPSFIFSHSCMGTVRPGHTACTTVQFKGNQKTCSLLVSSPRGHVGNDGLFKWVRQHEVGRDGPKKRPSATRLQSYSFDRITRHLRSPARTASSICWLKNNFKF